MFGNNNKKHKWNPQLYENKLRKSLFVFNITIPSAFKYRKVLDTKRNNFNSFDIVLKKVAYCKGTILIASAWEWSAEENILT
jgi:hypothetical protein